MSAACHLPLYALTHGQVRWVLRHALEGAVPTEATFDSYLKFLRRSGVPFEPDELPGQAGINVVYGFEHVMELGVALLLSRQGILRQDVVRLLVDMRDELRPLYRRAWTERESGLGSNVNVEVGGEEVCTAWGLWIDLGLRYAHEGVLTTTGPKLLGPREAVLKLCKINWALNFREPIRVSDLAEAIVRLAPAAPKIRRGRP